MRGMPQALTKRKGSLRQIERQIRKTQRSTKRKRNRKYY